MIRKIRIEGYQSLKSVEVELGHFTVILGESNVGKSALLRAVKALVENQTGLDDFLTVGAKVCQVELTLDVEENVLGVLWIKKKNGTQYLVHSTAGDSIDKFGKGVGVPVEVTNVLRMERIEFAPGIRFAPNFHDQFSTPFLLEETGGRVAKMLGEMSGVNLLYRATAEANVRAKRFQQLVESHVITLEALKEKLATYEYIRTTGPRLQEAKTLLADVEKDAKALALMTKFSIEWMSWRGTSDMAHVQQERLMSIDDAILPLEEALMNLADVKLMKGDLLGWLKISLYAKDCGKAKEKMSKLNAVSFGPIEEQANEIFVLRKTRDAWNNALHAVDYCVKYVKELKKEADQRFLCLQSLEKELKICPYCGALLHKEGDNCDRGWGDIITP